MWVYKSIQIIYIMYRYTCHGCKCMMMRMCMLTCMHALVYHMHQTTIPYASNHMRIHAGTYTGIHNHTSFSYRYIHTCTQKYEYTYMYAEIRMQMHALTHEHAPIHMHMCRCMCACVQAYVNEQTNMCIFTRD